MFFRLDFRFGCPIVMEYDLRMKLVSERDQVLNTKFGHGFVVVAVVENAIRANLFHFDFKYLPFFPVNGYFQMTCSLQTMNSAF